MGVTMKLFSLLAFSLPAFSLPLFSPPRLLKTSFLCGALAVTLLTPGTSFAQRDPEAAARQAEIDADEARSKIEDLQKEQIAAADVQNENTVEMNARDDLIQDYEQDEAYAEHREREAEAREK